MVDRDLSECRMQNLTGRRNLFNLSVEWGIALVMYRNWVTLMGGLRHSAQIDLQGEDLRAPRREYLHALRFHALKCSLSAKFLQL